ncbi:copine-3-like isoform X2 [Mizuhopecten yessoensis]|uniref:copine-3-like isoform X2 n=1 Tax=Mizuhopecten yessoensis TaxID=6573 RepID=UPI000B45F1B1|nr:copine-3-like isoform X2 [Mizuhopecten yessoensis]
MALRVGGSSGGPVSRVELRIECQNLLKKDTSSKSDPCAVFLLEKQGQWMEYGRTENIENCHDPKFTKTFVIDYFFEEVQKVKIQVFDIDNKSPQLTDDDFLGELQCNLGTIVSRNPMVEPLKKRNGHPIGGSVITIRSEEMKEGGEIAHMSFNAKKLDNKDFMGKSDPYIEMMRQGPDGSWQVTHRTEVIKNTLNPVWRPFSLPVHALCSGDHSKEIKFDVYDWDKDGSHDLIGGFTTSVKEMMAASDQEVTFQCINPKKKSKKKYENSGTVHLTSFKLSKPMTFLDYIYGGMQINFTVGIDFTASNGNPRSNTSLHFMDPNRPNEYVQATRAVGAICQDYDSDKMFPALGFGAKLPTGEVSFEFALNFNPSNPYCNGIEGVIAAYQNCIQSVELYGPTNVAPIIQHMARFAAQSQAEESTKGAGQYYVLLLLTDGALSDMPQTIQAIVNATALPMSIIIVGVGQADFSNMEMLDGDGGTLRAPNGQESRRDIVQFVPFRQFKNASAQELARQVLAEVPQQVVQYFTMRGLTPNKKPA